MSEEKKIYGVPFTMSLSLVILRVAIGVVYVWFGFLKIAGVSPVTELIQNTYSFLPYGLFGPLLGIFETVIGLMLITNFKLRYALYLLWLQLAGVFGSVLLNPSVFFNGNPLSLTLEGEFMAKNFITLAASLVIFVSLHEEKDGD